MKPSLVILSGGQSPRTDIMPLLLEHLPEEQITCVGLLDGLTHQQIKQQYAPDAGEKTLTLRIDNDRDVMLSAEKIEGGLQRRILELEEGGYDTILLLQPDTSQRLFSSTAVLLEPHRIVPPLVAAIVDGHQAGIVVSKAGQITAQASKWKNLARPLFCRGQSLSCR